MSLVLGKLAMNGGGSTGPATWHRCNDMPAPLRTQNYNKVVAVMKVDGRYLIYIARPVSSSLTRLYEYNPYTDTWTQKAGLTGTIASVPDYHHLVTVGRKLYFFVAQPGNNTNAMTVFQWDQPTDTWSPAAGFTVLTPVGATVLRWISAVYLPTDPTVIRVWLLGGSTWYYFRWTIGTATLTGGPAAGITTSATNHLHGLWKDTDASPSQSLEQSNAGNSLREVYRRTWNSTTPSAQTRVDSPVSEFGFTYGGEAEFNTTRIGYEYDENPPPGVANVVANPWNYDASFAGPGQPIKVISGGLKVITPAGQTFWLGTDWALTGTSTWPGFVYGTSTTLTLPWDSYVPALGFSDTYGVPGAGIPTATYGKALRTSAICYAAGCIFMFGGSFWGFDYLYGGVPVPNGALYQPWVLRYGNVAGGGGGMY